MAEKKEMKEKKITTKKPSTRKTTKKKDPEEMKMKETKEEELVETPIPDPEEIDLHAETNAAEAIEEMPIPDFDLEPKPIPKGKPEKLETLMINEDLEDPECKKEELGIITTADLKPPPIVKAKKAHNAANDVIITTTDFKPRKWGESKKL